MPKNTRNRTRNRKKSNLGSPVSINLPQGAIKEAGDSLVNIQRQSAEIMGPALRIVRNVVLVGVVGGITYFGVKLFLKNRAQSDIYNKMIAGDKAAEAALSLAMLLDKNIIQQLLDTITGNITSAVESVKDSLFLNTIMGPADAVSNLFKGLGISSLSQKLNYIAANIHMNNVDTKAVQSYFYKYTGGKLLYRRIPLSVKKKEAALFFEYLTGKRKLTAEQAQVSPNQGELPSAGQASIVENVQGKIVVFNHKGYLWNNNIRAGGSIANYTLTELSTGLQRETFKVNKYISPTVLYKYGARDSAGFVYANFPVGIATGQVYNRDQWGPNNAQFYEVVCADYKGNDKAKFWVLKNDVLLYENAGLANVSVEKIRNNLPGSNTVLWGLGKLQELEREGGFSLSGIPQKAQRSVLSLPLFGL